MSIEAMKEIFKRGDETIEYWRERYEIEKGELRIANAEMAALMDQLWVVVADYRIALNEIKAMADWIESDQAGPYTYNTHIARIILKEATK